MTQNLLLDIGDIFKGLLEQSGIMNGSVENYIMLGISFVLFFLAIVKKFEPLLLLPIAFGMFLVNIPGAYRIVWGEYIGNITEMSEFTAAGGILPQQYLFSDGKIIETLSGNVVVLSDFIEAGGVIPEGYTLTNGVVEALHTYYNVTESSRGLLWYLFFGVEHVIYPPLIFLGIGAMTDFGPLISNPKSMLIGAAAQLGIFIALFFAVILGFDLAAACSIAIIGGADGPTAIYVTQKMSQYTDKNLLSAIAIAAYSYMALIPLIQKPIMRLLVPKKERAIKMTQLRKVTKLEKIIFPITVTLVVGLLLPDAMPLLGMLMLGNLLKESGVTERLSSQAQNGLMNTITIFLGICVGSKAFGSVFLSVETLQIIALGLFAFAFGTIGGLLMGRIMCKLSGGKINPLIGSAGVSAVPMAARISEDVGRETDPSNHLLMHAMGPNVAGVIGSAIAAGFLISLF